MVPLSRGVRKTGPVTWVRRHDEGAEVSVPWKESYVVDEREKFVREWMRRRAPVGALCDEFGVSRKTGDKWIRRFEQEGLAGLVDRSRAPRHQANRTSEEVVRELIALRERFPFWGPKKIKAHLEQNRATESWPAASTIGDILARAGLVQERKRRRRVPRRTQPFAACSAPNVVWCADFKGHFRVGGRYCYPLTITDGFSRYLVQCEGMTNQQTEPVWEAFERAFHEYGLPHRIRTDNGSPFASRSPGGLSRLSIRWVKLGIVPERIEPGKPQQNGRHERMHRTLKTQTTQPAHKSFEAQQEAFDNFRHHFNTERPHEALGQKTPVSLYQPSPRRMPTRLQDPEYPDDFKVLRVKKTGGIWWRGSEVSVGSPLGRETVGAEPVGDGVWNLWFGPVYLGTLKELGGNRIRFDKNQPNEMNQ